MKKTILIASTVSLLLLGGCENKKELLKGEWKEKGLDNSYLTVEDDKLITEFNYSEDELSYKFKNKEDNKFELYIKETDSTVKGKFVRNNKEFVVYSDDNPDEQEIYERID